MHCHQVQLAPGLPYRPLVELLFARLPLDLQRVAMKHVTRFMLGTTMPSVSNEASLICNAAAWAAPEAAGELMLEPMMQRIEDELSYSGGASARLSKASPSGFVPWAAPPQGVRHLGAAALLSPLVQTCCAAVVGQQGCPAEVWSWLLVPMMQKIEGRASQGKHMSLHLDAAAELSPGCQ